jgi:hypothetical protein
VISDVLTNSITINPYTPIVNTAPVIAFTGTTIGTGFIVANNVSTDIEITDPDNDNIKLMYSLNN